VSFDLVKYPNRRPYSSDLRRYVTLADVGNAFDKGDTVRVTMHRGRDDVTIPVLLAMLAERVAAGRLELTQAQLQKLVRS
jgi:polyhydroxyalkanoate synthesis regulator protein